MLRMKRSGGVADEQPDGPVAEVSDQELPLRQPQLG